MERAVARRRRGAAGGLSCLALVAFGLGATVGDVGTTVGDERSAAELSAADILPPKLLAGERIVVGVNGTSVGSGLRLAIHQGRIAGVVLFAGNFPSRAAGRRLIARLQAIPRPPKLRDP